MLDLTQLRFVQPTRWQRARWWIICRRDYLYAAIIATMAWAGLGWALGWFQ